MSPLSPPVVLRDARAALERVVRWGPVSHLIARPASAAIVVEDWTDVAVVMYARAERPC